MRLNSGIHHFDGKVIYSGDIVEIYHYSNGVFKGVVSNKNGRKGNGNITDEERARNREISLSRARKEFMRTVNANVGRYGDIRPKFVTFTFSDNVEDLKAANMVWGKFIKRLNYHVYGKKCSRLQYGVVIQFQKRGAVHYHVIFFNLPYIECVELERIWGQGFIKINAIDNVDNVGAYVCRYMSRDFDDDRLKGNKCYFFSRGVLKPKEIYLDYDDLESIKKSLPGQAMTYKGNYENEYVGEVEYIQYNLSILES